MRMPAFLLSVSIGFIVFVAGNPHVLCSQSLTERGPVLISKRVFVVKSSKNVNSSQAGIEVVEKYTALNYLLVFIRDSNTVFIDDVRHKLIGASSPSLTE